MTERTATTADDAAPDPPPDDDRHRYSYAALARLALCWELAELAEGAAAAVPTHFDHATPAGELVEFADRLVAQAQTVRDQAVIYERERGTSWEDIGAAVNRTKQATHERYKPAVDEWRAALVEPLRPARPGTTLRSQRLHDAAYSPTATGRRLDAWARRHTRHTDDDHPVTGHLPPLTVLHESSALLDAFAHARKHDLQGEERARLYDRRARLYDRIATEQNDPEAAEAAAAARAYAAEIRRTTDQENRP